MVWKCITCAIELRDASIPPGEKGETEYLDGCLPALDGGGTIDINFGYGSAFDSLVHRDVVIQGAICDKCFVARKNCVRILKETKKISWEQLLWDSIFEA